MEGMEVMVGLGQGWGQKLPWHQWGRMAAVRYHTGSCCAPSASRVVQDTTSVKLESTLVCLNGPH